MSTAATPAPQPEQKVLNDILLERLITEVTINTKEVRLMRAEHGQTQIVVAGMRTSLDELVGTKYKEGSFQRLSRKVEWHDKVINRALGAIVVLPILGKFFAWFVKEKVGK